MEEIKMRTWLQKLERMAAAVAFAEEGEWQMASGILQDSAKKPVVRDTDRKDRPRPRNRDRSLRV
jgi:hypothetical protein